MLFIAEILLFGTGVYLAATGKAGAWIAGKGYTAEGGQARLAGVILALPLPLAFCAGLVLGLFAPDQLGLATFIEIAMVLGSAIIATIMLRRIRKAAGVVVVDSSANIEPK
jgi:hypothetical protein